MAVFIISPKCLGLRRELERGVPRVPPHPCPAGPCCPRPRSLNEAGERGLGQLSQALPRGRVPGFRTPAWGPAPPAGPCPPQVFRPLPHRAAAEEEQSLPHPKGKGLAEPTPAVRGTGQGAQYRAHTRPVPEKQFQAAIKDEHPVMDAFATTAPPPRGRVARGGQRARGHPGARSRGDWALSPRAPQSCSPGTHPPPVDGLTDARGASGGR